MEIDPFEFIKDDGDETPKRYCDKCDRVVLKETLHCHKCGVCKPRADFGKHGGNKKREGLDYYCKPCRNKYKRDSSKSSG